MGLFSRKTAKVGEEPAPVENAKPVDTTRSNLNELVLQSIHEGVVIVDKNGNIQLANPAACRLLGRSADELSKVYYDSVINLLDKTGQRISEGRNPIGLAIKGNEYKEETRDLDVVAADSNKNTPVSIIITPTDSEGSNFVVTFRDIAQELREERERSDFISTGSMRGLIWPSSSFDVSSKSWNKRPKCFEFSCAFSIKLRARSSIVAVAGYNTRSR